MDTGSDGISMPLKVSNGTSFFFLVEVGDPYILTIIELIGLIELAFIYPRFEVSIKCCSSGLQRSQLSEVVSSASASFRAKQVQRSL